MAHTTEGATECVESVIFGVMSDEEVRRQSCMKITNPTLFDRLDTPKLGGLYDPALGSLDELTPCKSCGLPSRRCPGHCGHIDLVLPVYNPLLFKNLFNLLKKFCFFCHHFKDADELVERYSFQLELIIKGDIVGAKNLDSLSPNEPLSSRENDSVNVNDATCHSRTHAFETKHREQHRWTSIQQGEAMSLLDEFMKRKKKSCERCGAKSPNITSPTFGWIYMDMPNKRTRENVILGSKLMQPSLGGSIVDSDDVNSSGAVYDEMSTSVTKKGKKNKDPAEFLEQTKVLSGPLLPTEAKHYIELLWKSEKRLCSLISNIQQNGLCTPENKGSYSMFFIEALVVPPIKFRPPSKGGISVMEHPQTALLSQVLQRNLSLGNAHMNTTQHLLVVRRWMDLQLSVNLLFGNKRSTSQRDNIGIGVCQLLEKKEGIFRQKLMGKRVDYACRSVISPDPYLAVNEIGIPPYFALRLTYPERVTPWNVTKLRNAIINGPDVHPGATFYIENLRTTKLATGRKSCNSISRKLHSSRGVVVQSGKSLEHELEGKVVCRHLQDGDVVLVNRQPTLHKPSIMAHVVRVLKGEKTIRMHYANCSSYNADFDGDEMNVHFPQDEISRAEALNIVNADNQYIIPTSGDTKRGLIQDHIVSAVLLTKRDTFLTWEEYDYLLCASGVIASARVGSIRKYGRKVSLLNTADEIQYLQPAILKPVPLWTGKQVITSILNHLTRIRGVRPFTTKKPSTIRKEYFGRQSGEGKFFVLNNYLVRGVIDKSQFGKYGLVHTIQELYGSHTAGVLLSTLSRLFTIFLQMHGFTCGVDDLLIVKSLDKVRKKIFERRVGEQVHAEFLGYKEDLDIKTLQDEIEKVMRVNGEAATARLDKMMSSRNAKLTNEVNDKLFPSNSSPIGLLKPFPRNCFFLMTASGAKGSQVNFQQVSSLLGQQELEGKRVPRMISGKTLPCFPPWDPSSRAGGFISDRYLTGLRPQEYYFHCMAGREGLVDTAVKTSRSGYLQRCLVKSLECLKVCYDHTVRDADGSVVQFCYGEDGIDVHKTSFLSKIKTLVVNREVVQGRLSDKCETARFTNSNDYIKGLPEALKKSTNDFIMKFSKKCQMREALMNKLSKGPHPTRLLREPQVISKLMELKYLSSLAEPGEPVGVIAAQSIGEPSTQMTLNTFHHAGQGGEVNVTLGIPRLQEILMRASENIQTPVMTCPLQRGKTRDDADCLAAKFMKVSVADVVENMEVCVVPFSVYRKKACTLYKLKMKLYSPELYPRFSDISLKDCQKTLEHVFVDELERAIKTHLTMLSKISGIKNFVQKNASGDDEESDGDLDSKHEQTGQENGKGDDGDNDDDDDDDDGEAEDLGADAQKRKSQARDEMEYEDSIENEASMNESEYIDGEPSGGFESEVDQGDPEISNDVNDDAQIHDAEDESEPGAAKKNRDRTVFVEAKGLDFEVHLRFIDEPYILLSEIAQKAAKNVYIKRASNINQCSVVEKDNRYQLQTAGVNFQAFWQMQDDLDINQIFSNDIHAILRTYGVEAARATLMKQVNAVFEDHGISVNIRHLTLVADFMTHSGQYRPMSRHGMAASVSPFSKMSFETAAEFIIKAAYHGEVDYLEAPSARICLGLPVKMGTGSFDLMQKIDI